jgi:phosphate transport system ATP-binding protein
MTAFFNVEPTEKGGRIGYLVEYDKTEAIFKLLKKKQHSSTLADGSGKDGRE